jgi:hypothetical protein
MLFFGSMKNSENVKEFVYADVEIKFFSYKKESIELIKKYFDEFITSYNFGTRKSKGFGSFTTNNIVLPKGKKVYSFEASLKDDDEWIKYLGYFYKFLRQGINEYRRKNNKFYNIFYAKPLIFEYACKKGIVWEKKAIKERLNLNNSKAISCKGERKIVRDLLGLSTNQSWMSYRISVVKEHNQIERYPSPLFFKPIKDKNKMKIYFWNRSDEIGSINNQTFNIKIQGRISDRFRLSTADIDIDDFLEFVYENKNNYKKFIKHSSSQGRVIENYLNKVFSTLKVENG